MNTNSRRAPGRVIVVGPRLDARGGVAVVNATYEAAGLFDAGGRDYSVRYFPSTRDGALPKKLLYAAVRFAVFAFTPLPRPSVVHLHTTSHASFWRKAAYATLARLKGARVIHHIHAFGFFDYYDAGGIVRRTAVRETLGRADALIALTQGMAARLRLVAPNRTADVLSNPVDLSGLRVEPVPARDPNLIAFLGWFVREKGIYELLDAVAVARRRRPGLRLVLGGSRNEEDVRAYIRALGLDDCVTMRGWLERRGVAQLLHECSVLALPSHTEGFGLVLVEAMACGTPIVTCPVGGVPEVVQSPRNAMFVPPGDVAALSEALVDILGAPQLRERMAASGPRDASRFDSRHIVERLRAIYARVLTESRAER